MLHVQGPLLKMRWPQFCLYVKEILVQTAEEYGISNKQTKQKGKQMQNNFLRSVQHRRNRLTVSERLRDESSMKD